MANELKFGSKVIFLNGSPLTLPTAASDPGSAVAGDLYYNSTDNTVHYYNGSSWTSLGTVSLTGQVLSSAHIVVGNGSNLSASVAVTGDISLSNAGVTAIVATSNSTLTTLSALSLPGSQVTGNIAGNAANITATSNSTFTTLSALSLPTSQLTGTLGITHGGTGQITAPLAFAALSPLTTAGDIVFENATPAPARLGIGSNGNVLTVVSGLPAWAPPAAAGTVTSVALLDGSSTPIYSISGSPVTSSGTLDFTLINQSANTIFAGPSTGSAAQPGFRSLVSADIPSLAALYLSLSGGTMTGAINLGGFAPTNSTTPVNPNDLVNKSYVDNFINATSWKTAVLVATTANITLSGEQTIDGVTTSASRVLVKNQSTASQNGIYVSGSGSWTRSSDMNLWSEVPAAAVFVESGTVGADLGFVCTSQPGGTLGTTAINFVQFSSAGSYSADGTTLQLVSSVFSIKNAGVGIAQLGTITDGVTLDQTGAGSSLEVKAGGIGTTQLAANSVTYAKFQQVAASSLVGNATGSLANAAAISLGATLAFSGSALQTVAMTGDVTSSANSFATTVAKIQGTVVSGTTGSGNVVFSASPTLTGTALAAAITMSGNLSVSNIVSTGAMTLAANAGASVLDIEALSFGRSVDGVNFVTETYVDSTTLTDNSSPTAVTAFQFAVATFAGEEISYVIKTGTSNVDTRVGTLRVTANSSGTIVPSVSDMYTESADCGIIWTATNSGGTISVSYTAANQGANRTMRADVKQFRR